MLGSLRFPFSLEISQNYKNDSKTNLAFHCNELIKKLLPYDKQFLSDFFSRVYFKNVI